MKYYVLLISMFVFFIVGCSQTSEVTTNEPDIVSQSSTYDVANESAVTVPVDPSEIVLETSPEALIDNYVQFEAIIACRLTKASMEENSTAIFEAMGSIELIADNLGLTMNNISTFSTQFQNDIEFMERVESKMSTLCPDEYRIMLERSEE